MKLTRTLFLPVILLLACSSPTEPGEALVLGQFHDVGSDVGRVLVPDSVGADVAFDVQFETAGDACRRLGNTETRQESWGVTLTPYDWAPTTAVSCSRILQTFTHRTAVSFEEPGEYTIRIVGWGMRSADTIALERRVTVLGDKPVS